MNRRFFTKVTSTSLIAFVAGCTSLESESDDQDENGSTDEDSSADNEPADETDNEEETNGESDDSASPDEEGEDEPDDEETDLDDDEDAGDGTGEPDDTNETDDDTDPEETDDEDGDDDTDESDDSDDSDQDEDDDIDDPDEDDDLPTDDELEATIDIGTELEEMLEVVDHEFIWESYQGSHLCNIRVELQNATSDTDIWFDGIGSVTDADGTGLGGDIARFGLQPQEATTHVFSMDGCADASGYRLEFETFDDG